MTGWIIFGILAALILLILLAPIRLRITYHNEVLDWEARYLFFRATPAFLERRKQKQKRRRQKKSKNAPVGDTTSPAVKESAPDGTAAQPDKPEPSKPSAKKPAKKKKESALAGFKPTNLAEGIELLRNLLDSSHKPLRRILKGFSIRKLHLDLIIGAPDAYTCAMRFGRANILVYNTLGYLSQFFRIYAEHVAVRADFDKEHGVYDASCVLQMAPITAISAAFGFILRFFVNTRKAKSTNTQQKAAA